MHHASRLPVDDRGLAKARQEQWARRACDRVVLDLPFPVSTNALWRRGRTGMIRAERYEQWCAAAGTMLNAQRPGCVRGPYRMILQVQRKDGRKRDIGNLEKGVSDLLQHHGVVEDDSLAQSITVSWSDFVTGCRVTVEAA